MIYKNKVSLIGTSFKNSELEIKKSLNSLLSQNYKFLEIIIIIPPFYNNEKLFRCYEKKFKIIKVFKTKKLENIGTSLNLAIKKTSGEFIARFDFDDFNFKNRIFEQINFLKKNKNLAFCGSHAVVTYKSRTFHRRYPISKLYFYFYLFFMNPICHPTVMFKRKIFTKKFFYNENLFFSEDLDLWLRLISSNIKYKNIDKYLIKYNEKQLIRNKKNFINNYLIRKKYSKRIFGFFLGRLNIFIYQILFLVFYHQVKYIYNRIFNG